ncbi:uncharacterized protein EV420DRAFT_1488807 [Desarmillaria tabescens]|uniref:Uncharacterized protein n=1 Tax=Armillaria tabescens TaxID=1929756 RepID=A0AA39J2G7_ARMTA|nr:uncharacterized protein EV420DRAFT_1488807 [Desarmillaria tabescens]KAK0434052.1 hypothetical protein EV420DRAFT_1488807 [Desarmillaria tabescens]
MILGPSGCRNGAEDASPVFIPLTHSIAPDNDGGGGQGVTKNSGQGMEGEKVYWRGAEGQEGAREVRMRMAGDDNGKHIFLAIKGMGSDFAKEDEKHGKKPARLAQGATSLPHPRTTITGDDDARRRLHLPSITCHCCHYATSPLYEFDLAHCNSRGAELGLLMAAA